jgi:hypothetical protein
MTASVASLATVEDDVVGTVMKARNGGAFGNAGIAGRLGSVRLRRLGRNRLDGRRPVLGNAGRNAGDTGHIAAMRRGCADSARANARRLVLGQAYRVADSRSSRLCSRQLKLGHRLGRRWCGEYVWHCLRRMSQERKSRKPNVMPLGVGGGELEGALRRQNENGTVKDRRGTLGRRVVVFDVEDRLDCDCGEVLVCE